MRPLYLTLLMLAVSLSAAAQDAASDGNVYPIRGASTIGLRGVWYEPADGDRGSWNPGVQVRHHLTTRLAVEGSADYQRHEFPNATAHTAAAQASALAYLLPGRFSLFLLGGGGYYATRLDSPNYRRNLGRFAPHVGAGAQLFANETWSFDASYRRVMIEDIEVRDTASDVTRVYKRAGDQLSFALNYRLGAD